MPVLLRAGDAEPKPPTGRLLSWRRPWQGGRGCKAQGVKVVYLGTTAKFLAAHRFYEKNGFREILRAELPARFPVMAADTKFYCRAS